ncbi:MAG: AAA family ATPase [Muribaculaceae bacterium]|nr:AAA family ATPase [Muribaculaceae bacterium]
MTVSPRRAADTPESGIDMENPEFRVLLRLVEETNASIFLTGKAGTGKSTFLRYIISHTHKKHAVLAPTGVAAVNVGGQTLHSFFHLPLRPVLPDDPEFQPKRLRDRLNITGRQIKLFREVELIIIDEISMVRADVIDLVDRILRTFGGDRRKPFGGKQLLLVGDVFQLEPVVTTEDRNILQHRYRHPFFFNACVFADFGLSSIELRKVYRQNETSFVEILDRFRDGTPSHSDILAINSRLTDGDTTDGDTSHMVMTLAARRDTVRRINATMLEQIEAKPVTYRGEVTGEFPESAYPTDLELILKTGAQVIFLRNDPERRFVNGTLGRVITATADTLTVQLENGTELDVDPVMWENVSYEYDSKNKTVATHVKGTFTQYPVRTAWALTIHKSQGLTFDCVDIDLGGGAFAGGQVYVALSRCRTLDGIRLHTHIGAHDVFVNPEVIRFSRTFNDRREQEEALRRAGADRLLKEASAAFGRADFRTAVDKVHEAFIANPALNTPVMRRYISMRLTAALSRSTGKRRKK